MIDFRYHLVSLVAVFMALATGILVGSSLLNQSLIDNQRATIASQAEEKEALRRDLDAVRSEVIYRDNYLATLTSALLPGRLTGHRVVLVSMPGAADSQADALARTLTDAGAQMAGRVKVGEAFFTPDEATEAQAAKVAERDAIITQFGLPAVRSESADTQLAAALLDRSANGPLGGPADTLLDELDRAGMINRDRLTDRADGAVLLVGAPPAEALTTTDAVRAGIVGLAAALDGAGNGTVVAGPVDAAVGGALDGIREADSTASVVSTVDTVESPFGRIATVYALAEQFDGGSGHYGTNASADSPLPRSRPGVDDES